LAAEEATNASVEPSGDEIDETDAAKRRRQKEDRTDVVYESLSRIQSSKKL
jgi:hypothetical protein